MPLTHKQQTQYASLLAELRRMERVIVAFSGGVDSALLLHAAHAALGEGSLAVTFATPYTPRAETACAADMAEKKKVRHRIVALPLPAAIRENPPDRCYLCKRALFGELVRIAKEEGIEHVLDGGNLDDLDEHRPGRKAVRELGVRSPLLDAGLTKRDIRNLSREEGLPTWNKPADACLLTRIPHGVGITEQELERIDRGESCLKSEGFPVVRLRSHGALARIELPSEAIPAFLDPLLRKRIGAHLKELGYRHVAVDLAGYRTGSLNAPLAATGRKEQCYDE
jgi:conserved hypothetical protein TIGR00268